MAKKTAYQVGTEVVTTMNEVVNILGYKITKKEILAGTVEGVNIIEIDDEDATIEPIEEIDEPTIESDSTDGPTDSDTDSDDSTNEVDDEEVDEIEYPEKGSFKDEKAIKKFIKKLTDDQLFEWCELEGVTWKRCLEQPPIDRMRAAMAIKAFHFASLAPAKSKKKGKYSDYTTEQLVQMATENGITVRDAKGDSKIQRMYTIMALKDAGLLA